MVEEAIANKPGLQITYTYIYQFNKPIKSHIENMA